MKNNIILIMADQFRGDCIGAAGNPCIITPYLDELASDACFFRRGYSPSPTCVPARACMITGQKASSAGFFSNDFSVRWEYHDTLMQRLQASGYQTINVGKNHFKPQRSKLGFEVNLLYETETDENGEPSDYHRWLKQKCGADFEETAEKFDHNGWPVHPWTAPPELHPTEWTVTTAIEQLKLRDPTRPFYMQVSFHRPHPPLDPPQAILDLYRDIDIPDPAIGDWAPEFSQDTACLYPFEGRIPYGDLKRAQKAYYAAITHIDSQIGRLIYYLRKSKLYNNTTIFFVSDHGEMLGDHNMFRKGPFLDGSARIPFIVKFAKDICEGSRGHTLDMPVSLLDLMPTCLSLAGLPITSELDGQDLTALLRNPPEQRFVFGENYRSNRLITTGGAYVTDGHCKYIWNSWLGRELLFDLDQDPQELHDLSGDGKYHDTLLQMRQIVIDEYRTRPADNMLDEHGHLKSGRVLPAYRPAP